MLSARRIFRLCRQSQCVLARSSIYFSTNADDDSNSKKPPVGPETDNDSSEVLLNASSPKKPPIKPETDIDSSEALLNASSNPKKPPVKPEIDNDSLEALLNASFFGNTISKAQVKSSTKAETQKTSSSDFSAIKKGALKLAAPGKINQDIDHLKKPRKHSSEAISGNKLQKRLAESQTSTPQPITSAIQEGKPNLVSSELLVRLRKLAQEVSGPAGASGNIVAKDLISRLEAPATDDQLNINEITFGVSSSGDFNHSLDLLRNKVVTEEQLYKIIPGPSHSPWLSQQSLIEDRMRFWYDNCIWLSFAAAYTKSKSEFSQRKGLPRELDMSLYPKTKLGIFTLEKNQRTESLLKTYHRLEQREIALSHSYAPRNWFEQCIHWTDQGKLWHFPINNEQGLEEENAVSFTEHIFLEDHLEGWCPTFGPVRHFMELVCLGLSKNPYVSVKEKIDNIMWYRDYFEKHRELLEAAGTLDSGVTKVPAFEAQ